jgi:hypothetical protein
VAKSDDKKAGPDEAKLPGEEMGADSDLFGGISDLEEMDLSGLLGAPMTDEIPVEPVAEGAAIDPLAAMPEAVAAQETPPQSPEQAPAAKKSVKLPGQYMEWGGAFLLFIVLLTAASLRIIFFSTAVYVIVVGLVCYAIWKSRATNTVYIVILGCTLVAILTAVYCLWTELDRYDFDVKARKAKQPFGMMQTRGIPDTQRIV